MHAQSLPNAEVLSHSMSAYSALCLPGVERGLGAGVGRRGRAETLVQETRSITSIKNI